MKYLPKDRASGHTGYQQQVKETNIKRIFDLVRSGKCKSRAEIVRQMDLSATSVSVLVEELAHRKLIDETGPTQTALPGRRPISLRLNTDAHHMAVFSVVPEGVHFAVLSLDCHIVEKLFYPLDCHTMDGDYATDEYPRVFEEILRKRSRKFSPSKAIVVAVSFPGIYIARDRQFYTQSTLGFSVSEDGISRFQQRVGLPVFLCNSTRSMAYAEKKFLDAAHPDGPETENLLFVKIQAAIRSALILGGDIYRGPLNVSGEIGHISIDYNGKPCYCGNTGCLERYTTLDAILEDAQNAASAAGIEPPQTFDELAKRYPDEPALLESVMQSARLLAFGLYSVLCSSGLRHVVLGGGIAALGDPFLREVYHALMGRGLLIRALDLSYAQAGPDADILGIGHYFLDKVFTVTQ